jgi:hypothetical protein
VFPTFDRFLLLALLTSMIRAHDHHRDPRPLPIVASDRAVAAHATTALWRPAPHRQPRLPGRHHLPAAHRYPLAAAAYPRARLRQPGHLLAATACWQHAGVWQQLQQLLLDELGRQGQLDWSRASLDSISVRAKRGAA